jgi:hypothetical protein
MRLFLSSAAEDEAAAGEIVAWLRRKEFEVYHWRDPRRRAERFLEQIEEEVNQADAFLAVLSPNFLRSPWCLLERDLAIHREQDLQTGDPHRVFIYVLQVAETPLPQARSLRRYDWLNLTTAASKESELGILAGKLSESGSAGPTSLGVSDLGLSSPLFRNRRDELELIQRNLTTASGQPFWLVVAPPDLGKSWFLQRLGTEMALSERSRLSVRPSQWKTRLVDVRELPLDARGDAAILLEKLFGLPSPLTTGSKSLRDIAQLIGVGGTRYLCLLDGADLLEEETAKTLRSCLAQIHRGLTEAGGSDVRLGFVVASRREAEWRGIAPAPRIASLSLTEFKVEVVRDALDDLASRMGHRVSPAELQQNAMRVHELSEGLPALLVACLQWIKRQAWLDMKRLERQEVFEELAKPYIERDLLSADSLLPWGGRNLRAAQDVLKHAFRILSRYRVITLSHLRHHLESDPDFRAALGRAAWSIEQLWEAIGATALLVRPLPEPWQEIYPPIRRILYRYHCRSQPQRVAAHREARRFVELWADKQTGKEQVTALVECLWHEANMLRSKRRGALVEELSNSAEYRSQTLRPSPAYTVAELRAYAVQRMQDDEELQQAFGHVPGLFDKIVSIVASPQESGNG